jgi:hypothetical protein
VIPAFRERRPFSKEGFGYYNDLCSFGKTAWFSRERSQPFFPWKSADSRERGVLVFTALA